MIRRKSCLVVLNRLGATLFAIALYSRRSSNQTVALDFSHASRTLFALRLRTISSSGKLFAPVTANLPSVLVGVRSITRRHSSLPMQRGKFFRISRSSPARPSSLVQRFELSCAAAHGSLAVEGCWYPGSCRHGAGWTRLQGDERALHACWHRSFGKGGRGFA